MTTTNSRKVLVPLATLLAAGAVAVGSGATWTSTTTSSIAVTGGTLVHTNSQDLATLSVTNLKPGASETGSLTLTNTGSLDSTVSLKETASSNGFASTMLHLTITANTGTGPVTVYDGEFGGMVNGAVYNLAPVLQQETDDSVVITFTVSLDVNSTNVDQGALASASYDFITTQTNATNDESSSIWS